MLAEMGTDPAELKSWHHQDLVTSRCQEAPEGGGEGLGIWDTFWGRESQKLTHIYL